MCHARESGVSSRPAAPPLLIYRLRRVTGSPVKPGDDEEASDFRKDEKHERKSLCLPSPPEPPHSGARPMTASLTVPKCAGVRQSPLVPAGELPVLLERQDRTDAGQRLRHDLQLQRLAPRQGRLVRHRLCHPRRGSDRDDQHRRCRHQGAEDRPEGASGVCAICRRAESADVRGGVSPSSSLRGAKRRSNPVLALLLWIASLLSQ